MTHARCKFSVEKITPSQYNPEEEVISLSASYDPDDPEDTKFSKYTPWGSMEFGLSNPNLVGTFKLGDKFYVDLIRVEAD